MQPILNWRIMRRMILIAFLSLVVLAGLRADDVRYLTTAQFSERVFIGSYHGGVEPDLLRPSGVLQG